MLGNAFIAKMGVHENAFIAKMGRCENALLLQKELILDLMKLSFYYHIIVVQMKLYTDVIF